MAREKSANLVKNRCMHTGWGGASLYQNLHILLWGVYRSALRSVSRGGCSTSWRYLSRRPYLYPPPRLTGLDRNDWRTDIGGPTPASHPLAYDIQLSTLTHTSRTECRLTYQVRYGLVSYVRISTLRYERRGHQDDCCCQYICVSEFPMFSSCCQACKPV